MGRAHSTPAPAWPLSRNGHGGAGTPSRRTHLRRLGLIALIAVVVWALSGPAFGFSETWQLVINTGTTIITFLMVFLIQQSQNKDSEALHLKLDELLIAVKGADEQLVDAERLDEEKLLALASALTSRARKQHRQRARSRRRQ